MVKVTDNGNTKEFDDKEFSKLKEGMSGDASKRLKETKDGYVVIHRTTSSPSKTGLGYGQNK